MVRQLDRIDGLVDLAHDESRLRRLGNGVVVQALVRPMTKKIKESETIVVPGGLDFALWRGDEWRERMRSEDGRRLSLRTTRDYMAHGWFGYGPSLPQFTSNAVDDRTGRMVYARVGVQSTGEEITQRADHLNLPGEDDVCSVLRFVPEARNAELEAMLKSLVQGLGDVTMATQAKVVQHIMSL